MSLETHKDSPSKKQPLEQFACRWAGCTDPTFPSLAALVTHVSHEHLAQLSLSGSNVPVRYSCQWERCLRFYVEQPSRFALISHCRTHTGEKPYFCPIPECEKHFTRSDALAKHVKGVHDLHQHRDAIGLMRYRSDTGKIELPLDIDVQRLTDDQYTRLLQQDYDIRVPWWFLQGFVDVLLEGTDGAEAAGSTTLQAILDQPLETRQHDLARLRYKKYLQGGGSSTSGGGGSDVDDDNELILGHYVEQNVELGLLQNNTRQLLAGFEKDPKPSSRKLPSTEKIYESLRSTLATASKINRVVKARLDDAVKEKRRLWVLNQLLLDANLRLGLSAANTGIETDEVDEFLLKEGVE